MAGDRSTEFIGGAEVQQKLIAAGLIERGYSVSMICLDFGQPAYTNIDGIDIYRAHRPFGGIPVLRFFWPRLTSIWRCLKLAEADIYYYRTAGMLAGVVAAFARRHGRHSIFAAAGNPDLLNPTPKIRFARDRLIYEYGLRHVDTILVQNAVQQQLCKQEYGRESILIPNMYEMRKPESVDNPERQKVLWVGTIRRIKQPQCFLDLARALPSLRFQMVGGPDRANPRLFDTLKAEAAALPNVDFAGFVPYADVGSHFEKAAILVNTSESEGFPNTFLQAWAQGIPTVSFVDSGARIHGRIPGKVVRNQLDLCQTVEGLMDAPVERKELGLLGRDYVRQTHSPDKVLDLYEAVIRDL